jgi:hypothetical protein
MYTHPNCTNINLEEKLLKKIILHLFAEMSTGSSEARAVQAPFCSALVWLFILVVNMFIEFSVHLTALVTKGGSRIRTF